MRKSNCARSPQMPRSQPSPAPRHWLKSTLRLRLSLRAWRDPNPAVRLGALQSLANAPLDARLPLAGPLLSDPVRAVRLEAVSLLAPVPPAQLSAEQRAAFERASGEYVETQRYNADRAEARVNLGTFYANRGDAVKGEEEMKAAIRLDPFFLPAYVNLADLYRARGRDPDGERILREGLKVAPNSAIASLCARAGAGADEAHRRSAQGARASDYARAGQCALCICLCRGAAFNG